MTSLINDLMKGRLPLLKLLHSSWILD